MSNCICGARGIGLEGHECIPSLQQRIAELEARLETTKTHHDHACTTCKQLSDTSKYWQTAIAEIEEKNERLTAALKTAREVIAQAHKTLNCQTHATNCNIIGVGCSCGAVEQFIPERTEFYRLKNRLDLQAIDKADGNG